MAKYFQYKYLGRDSITVKEFLEDPNTPISNQVSVEDFLTYEAIEGIQNLDYIIQKYSKPALSAFASQINSLSGDIPIPGGTTLMLPKDMCLIDVITKAGESQFLEQKDYVGYFGRYVDLLKDPLYNRSQSTEIEGRGIDIRMLSESIKIWIWVRALDKIIDVSSFVNYCSTSKQEVGNFNLSLNPIKDIDDLIYITNDTFNNFPVNDLDKHTVDFFEKNLQYNDVVFIRFEQLGIDLYGDTLLKNVNTLYREPSHLKLHSSWDMIGLIDSCSVGYSAMSNEKTLDVSGRDFMKLLLEDGSYFLPYKYIEGKDIENKLVWGGNTEDDWFKRNFISGNFDTFFSYEMKPIKESLEFIINHLSNLGVTSDKLWSSYAERRKQPYKILDENGSAVTNLLVKGVWQIIELLTDDVIVNRRISGEGLINPNGTLYEFFNNICQKPFVEFWGDTYLDTFDLIVRQPPFTKAAIQQVLNNRLYIEVEEGDLHSYNLDWDTTFYSHYQIDPQSQWMGQDTGTLQSIIPIIYMPQYASTFGNKKMHIQDTYIDRLVIQGGKDKGMTNLIYSILDDYKFIIEANAYLPFTRRGTIQINGDRRIKKGGFIVNKATQELFYVEGVNHSFSASERQIDRTTTVTVSRGMKISHILDGGIGYITGFGLTDSGNDFGYFDIVDAQVIVENIKAKVDGKDPVYVGSIDTSFGVNDKAFQYFLTRKHFY